MTQASQNVRVNLGERSYDIEIGTELLVEAGRFVGQRATVSHTVVITDEHVEDAYARRVAEGLSQIASTVELLVVESGEKNKSIAVATTLWEELLRLGADRRSVVVAVGGGVIGDLAGFVAATFARGIGFFQVPTTLLAQVDSSVGGKVGINLPQAKNMVGAFLQPRGVLIDTQTLKTLPDREYRSGLGEVVKYGVILDAELFAYLEAHIQEILARDDEVLRHVVTRCCRLKADVVEKDEREETGLRAILNYGHTFGHALETLAGYGTFLHGEAVSIGMIAVSRLAERLGRFDASLVARQLDLLKAFGLPTELPRLAIEEFLQTMMHDKKVAHGRLHVILPLALGQVELTGDIDSQIVREVLEASMTPQ